MRFFPALILFPILLCADQVTLKNGDRVTGKIVKKDGANLVIKSELMGDLTLKWASVAAVATDQEVTLAAPAGDAVKGKLSTSNGKVEVAGTQVAMADVQAIRNAAEQARYERFQHPPITELWAGYIDLGLATAQGNAKTTTFNTAFTATRATLHDTTNLHFTQIYAQGLVNGQTSETAKAIRGGWTYNRNIGPRLFTNFFNDYEYDAFQNLDLRVNVGGGLGLKAWKSERGTLGIVGGGSYDRDEYNTPYDKTKPDQFTRDSGEAYWGDDFDYKLVQRSALKQSFRMFNNLTNTGEYRVNFDLGTETRIMKWLSWHVTASDRYLTNPSPGRKTNDLLVSSGIRLSFAR